MRAPLSRNGRQPIRAKKRCSRALPKCSRCLQKRWPCAYQNEPLDQAGASIEPGEAENAGPLLNRGRWPGGLANRHRFWSTTRGEIYWTGGQSIVRITEPVMLLPMDVESHGYLVQGLVRYPLEFTQQGSTGFIHRHTYQLYQPASLRAVQEICLMRLDRSLPIPSESPNHLIQSLLSAASSTVSFIDTLAFVQSLYLLQILALFSPNSTEDWTQRLWKSAPSELPGTISNAEAYLIAEAVRRTILTSHKIQGCYRVA